MLETGVAESATDAEDRPEISIQPVRSAVVGHIWEHVEPLIQAAVENGPGDEAVADILEMLNRRDTQLWLVLTDGKLGAAVVTTIAVKPRSKVCRLVYLGGEEPDAWAEQLYETLSSWARQLGCDAVEFWGRRGWGKIAKRLRFAHVQTVYRRKI